MGFEPQTRRIVHTSAVYDVGEYGALQGHGRRDTFSDGIYSQERPKVLYTYGQPYNLQHDVFGHACRPHTKRSGHNDNV